MNEGLDLHLAYTPSASMNMKLLVQQLGILWRLPVVELDGPVSIPLVVFASADASSSDLSFVKFALNLRSCIGFMTQPGNMPDDVKHRFGIKSAQFLGFPLAFGWEIAADWRGRDIPSSGSLETTDPLDVIFGLDLEGATSVCRLAGTPYSLVAQHGANLVFSVDPWQWGTPIFPVMWPIIRYWVSSLLHPRPLVAGEATFSLRVDDLPAASTYWSLPKETQVKREVKALLNHPWPITFMLNAMFGTVAGGELTEQPLGEIYPSVVSIIRNAVAAKQLEIGAHGWIHGTLQPNGKLNPEEYRYLSPSVTSETLTKTVDHLHEVYGVRPETFVPPVWRYSEFAPVSAYRAVRYLITGEPLSKAGNGPGEEITLFGTSHSAGFILVADNLWYSNGRLRLWDSNIWSCASLSGVPLHFSVHAFRIAGSRKHVMLRVLKLMRSSSRLSHWRIVFRLVRQIMLNTTDLLKRIHGHLPIVHVKTQATAMKWLRGVTLQEVVQEQGQIDIVLHIEEEQVTPLHLWFAKKPGGVTSTSGRASLDGCKVRLAELPIGNTRITVHFTE